MTSLKFHNGVWQSNLRPTTFISPPCLNRHLQQKQSIFILDLMWNKESNAHMLLNTAWSYLLCSLTLNNWCAMFPAHNFLSFVGNPAGFFVCFSFFPPHNWWSIMCALSKIIDTKRQAECLHEWAWWWGETAWLTTHPVNQTYVSIYSQKVCGKVVSYMVYSGARTHQKTHKSTIWGEDNKIQMTLISLRRLRERETVSKQGHLPKSGLVLSAEK